MHIVTFISHFVFQKLHLCMCNCVFERRRLVWRLFLLQILDLSVSSGHILRRTAQIPGPKTRLNLYGGA